MCRCGKMATYKTRVRRLQCHKDKQTTDIQDEQSFMPCLCIYPPNGKWYEGHIIKRQNHKYYVCYKEDGVKLWLKKHQVKESYHQSPDVPSTARSPKEASTTKFQKELYTIESPEKPSTTKSNQESHIDSSTSQPHVKPFTALFPVESSTTESPVDSSTTESPMEFCITESPEEPSAVESPEEPFTAESPEKPFTAESPEKPTAESHQQSSVESSTTESPMEFCITESPEEPSAAESPEEPSAAESPEEPSAAESHEKPSTAESPEKPTAESPEEPSAAESPEEPSAAESPEEPSTAESPEKPTAESPEEPSTAESPEEPSAAESPEEPSTVESPEKPSTAESPEKPSTAESPEEPSAAESPEEPPAAESPEEHSPAQSPEEPSTAEFPEEPSTAKSHEKPSTAESHEKPTAESPEEPSAAESPEEPSAAEYPEEPSTAEYPKEPSTAESSEEPSTAESPEKPSTAESPEKPSTAESPEEPSTAESDEKPSTAESHEKPTVESHVKLCTAESPETPPTAESPEKPSTANSPEKPSTAESHQQFPLKSSTTESPIEFCVTESPQVTSTTEFHQQTHMECSNFMFDALFPDEHEYDQPDEVNRDEDYQSSESSAVDDSGDEYQPSEPSEIDDSIDEDHGFESDMSEVFPMLSGKTCTAEYVTQNNMAESSAAYTSTVKYPAQMDHVSSTEGANEASSTSGSHSISINATDNSDGRKYDKKYFCYYCSKPQSKISRHLRTVHKGETEVEKYMAEENPKEKEIKLMILRHLGNHEHNCQVVRQKKGELLVLYRPTDSEGKDYRQYVPCKFCYGYLSKSSIWKHACPLAPSTGEKTRIRISKNGSMLLPTMAADMSKDLGFLICGMRGDQVGEVTMKDSLILQYGHHLLKKLGNDKEQHNYIRGKMRQMGRLLICLREKTGQHGATMFEFVHPTKFSIVAEAAKQCAGFDEATHTYGVPSQAIKSGQLLKKLAELKMTHSLEKGDLENTESASQFLKLCVFKWSEVSTTALRNLSERKRNGVMFLPLTEDVVTLNKYLQNEGKKHVSLLEQGNNADSYATLTKIALAKTVLFNRKRQGEVSKIKMKDWDAKTKANTSNELRLNFSDFEKSLLNVLERLEIRGKRGRIVPILITAEMNQWMKILLEKRSLYIPKSNTFLFPTPASSDSHIRGSDVIRKFASDCGAVKPDLLTSTKLRKHVASIAQVLSLTENEMDMLANFLGHDIRIHREFYRMPLDVLQVARVSKIFMAAETGNIGQFSGKGLSDIQIDDSEEIEFEDVRDSDEDSGSDAEVRDEYVFGKKDKGIKHKMQTHQSSGKKRCMPEEKEKIRSKQKQSTKRAAYEKTISTKIPKEQNIKQDRKRCCPKPWTAFEKDAVGMHFASFILRGKLPGKQPIIDFIEKVGLNRSWKNVKDHIRNQHIPK